MTEASKVLALRPNDDRAPIVVQPCWTVPELAAYLQVSRRTITTWIRQGRLQAHRLSTTVTVIQPAEVERFLAESSTGGQS